MPVNQSSFVSADRQVTNDNPLRRGPFPVEQEDDGFSPDRAAEALRESEERLRALQNEFAHLARLHELGEMAAAVAHEINQPLTAIANYLNAGRLSVRESTSEALAEARRAMALAAEQGMRAGAIIRGLRSFARKGDGTRRLEAADALLDSAMALALIGIDAAGIEVVRAPASGGMVEVDSLQIQQVLVNLLRNAVDAVMANPAGVKRRLTIATSDRADEGVVLFCIADTGPGIAPEIWGDLFRPFVTSKPKGMGMGLSVCRRIIEAHGGAIEVESEDGVGAVFTVRLTRVTGI